MLLKLVAAISIACILGVEATYNKNSHSVKELIQSNSKVSSHHSLSMVSQRKKQTIKTYQFLPTPDDIDASDIAFDKDGRLWMAAVNGSILYYSERGWERKDGAAAKRITVDRSGFVWIVDGTDGA